MTSRAKIQSLKNQLELTKSKLDQSESSLCHHDDYQEQNLVLANELSQKVSVIESQSLHLSKLMDDAEVDRNRLTEMELHVLDLKNSFDQKLKSERNAHSKAMSQATLKHATMAKEIQGSTKSYIQLQRVSVGFELRARARFEEYDKKLTCMGSERDAYRSGLNHLSFHVKCLETVSQLESKKLSSEREIHQTALWHMEFKMGALHTSINHARSQYLQLRSDYGMLGFKNLALQTQVNLLHSQADLAKSATLPIIAADAGSTLSAIKLVSKPASTEASTPLLSTLGDTAPPVLPDTANTKIVTDIMPALPPSVQANLAAVISNSEMLQPVPDKQPDYNTTAAETDITSVSPATILKSESIDNAAPGSPVVAAVKPSPLVFPVPMPATATAFAKPVMFDSQISTDGSVSGSSFHQSLGTLAPSPDPFSVPIAAGAAKAYEGTAVSPIEATVRLSWTENVSQTTLLSFTPPLLSEGEVEYLDNYFSTLGVPQWKGKENEAFSFLTDEEVAIMESQGTK
ncbi:hypothetical protein HDU79_011251 [Rhizoclosmatium sp. JEL0117]|nr:hypothetical protein HDU79_011251 [Rhizoclosmatium sp. JEL0117]